MTEEEQKLKMKKRLRDIKRITRRVRNRIMKIGLQTQCGHVASAMSVAELLVATYYDAPDAIVILSKGHGVLAQYVTLEEMGIVAEIGLKTYYKDGGLSGHATLNPEKHIYASTGSLGHGLAIGIGYAIANPDKKVVVIMSDGETEEGSTLESLLIIKRLEVKNILPVVEYNGWSGFKSVDERLIPTRRDAVIYYSTKGEWWGELEDTLQSHYAKVTSEIYKLYMEKYGKARSHNKRNAS